MKIRVGQGIDFHRLDTGLKLWLGGVLIPSGKGCVAHSDGDVLLHAICDSIFGAAGLPDIGHHFPDSDGQFRNIRSTVLLERTMDIIHNKGWKVSNIDSTVCLEEPRIAPYINEMKGVISKITGISVEDVSIKATTTEKLGYIGRGEGIAAMAICIIQS